MISEGTPSDQAVTAKYMGNKTVTRDGVEWQYFEEGEFREIREEVREYQWVTKK